MTSILKLPPFLILCSLMLTTPDRGVSAAEVKVTSPSGNHAIQFSLLEGVPHYSVSYQGTAILSDSGLSLDLDGEGFSDRFVVENTQTKSQNDSWVPVVGSRSSYPDAYNECVVQLREASGKKRRLDLTFRAYDEGVAFRYMIPAQEGIAKIKLRSEDSRFQFTDDHLVYWDDYPQAEYSKVRLSEMPDQAIRPLLLETGSHFVAIAEAGSLEHYAPMMLNRSGELQLVTRFRSGTVSATDSLTTPWRVVMVADHPGTLVEHHYLLQNLSEPSALDDTSWIKPGKVWRSNLATDAAKAIIDYAAANNYQYVHYDAGWYGPERAADSNPLTVIDSIDMPETIRYADEHGIGLICYINKIAMSRYDLDKTFRTYHQWGIRGVKFGFVDWRSQSDMEFLFASIKTAAKYNLVVDIHDNFRLTGIERTYPHVLTVEGILGNEELPERGNPPKNVLTTSFARMIAGAGDYTPCYLNGRVVSRSFQLALGVVFYSPLQYLHWYDQADRYAGRSYPELEFWKEMPTTWDDSKVVNGSIGSHMTVARKKGERWFVGTIVNEPRSLDIPLDFLGPGEFTAKIYAENPEDKKLVTIESRAVTSSSSLTATMSSGSGCAIMISPTPNATE
ncbi:glycoside hydrolase family 97 protein [Aporhodopirellula aestuarii]|uniref:Glycoside hydrolase family 97 protein n=1 Tax=Aporhodopirellula aestuarii TaxID=2950107 RepID=A0ABT0U7C7_9BACT|nr:glycoside hydrolase family 97 protein [Aporhodopirellula aestuarii]MCM2372844.1 glycoside hydrolase family 97 protein [Aporhodopirellula aestuarii]